MQELAARAYFLLCLALGRLLRSARYAKVRIVCENGSIEARKFRSFYAPLLIRLSGPLVRLLDTGVCVLTQRDWAERERRIYQSIYGRAIRVDEDGTLVLPCFPGQTLATLLEKQDVEERIRKWVIERAVIALSEFHHRGFTHGDAMAENVMVDGGVARWFDFETVHDASRPMAWRRADDVRALLVTCVVRTVPEKRAETLAFILDVYAEEEVTCALAASFTPVGRRSLTFHLSQAGLSFQCFAEIGRLLRERLQRAASSKTGDEGLCGSLNRA